jgi:hypothetical protein
MRCEECYQRFAELEREVETQKRIIDALIGVADKVIADRRVITDPAQIRDAFEGEE